MTFAVITAQKRQECGQTGLRHLGQEDDDDDDVSLRLNKCTGELHHEHHEQRNQTRSAYSIFWSQKFKGDQDGKMFNIGTVPDASSAITARRADPI